jgi:hypothetical protein
MCWIEFVNNFHPSATVRFRMLDYSRHPKIKSTGQELDHDDWYSVQPNSEVALENAGIPWAVNDQALWVEWTVDGKTATVQFDVCGRNWWDGVRVRDGEYHEIQWVEAGSLGYAAGTNHSWWRLVLGSNGQLRLECTNREGLSQDAVGNVLHVLQIMLEATANGLKIAAELVKDA